MPDPRWCDAPGALAGRCRAGRSRQKPDGGPPCGATSAHRFATSLRAGPPRADPVDHGVPHQVGARSPPRTGRHAMAPVAAGRCKPL